MSARAGLHRRLGLLVAIACAAASVLSSLPRGPTEGVAHAARQATMTPDASTDAGARPHRWWFPLQELTEDVGGAEDGFGWSVSMSGSLALIGAPGKMVASTARAGAAYVYASSGAPLRSPWGLRATLAASDGAADDAFGTSVALSSTVALVGAPGHSVQGNVRQGAAYLFVASGGAWTLAQEITAAGGAAYDAFGSSVSLDGGVAVIGAPGSTGSAGAAYVYTLSGSALTLQQKLVGLVGRNAARLGVSVANSGTSLILSAGYYCDAYESDAATTWSKAQTLGGCASAAMRPDIAATGASSAVTVYTRSADGGAGWAPEITLSVNSGVGDVSVALSSDTLLAGAGAQATAYPVGNGMWSASQVLLPNDPGGAGDQFGRSVALSDTTALIGAPGTAVDSRSGQGAVYVEVLGPSNGSVCASDAECGSGACVAGLCCNQPCGGSCQRCTTGVCQPLAQGAAATCGPYVCDGVDPACPTSCLRDTDCALGDYCAGGACVAQRAPGAPCATPNECQSGHCAGGACVGTSANGAACAAFSECASGFCVDGVCCNVPCDGQCQACDGPQEPGTCAPVTGATHGSRSPCARSGATCGGTCDGVALACVYPTRACGSACADGAETTSTCNGQGQCVAGLPHTCGNLTCADASTCKRACTTYADCLVGFSCDLATGACVPGGSACIDDHRSKDVSIPGDGGVTDCAPYACDPAHGECRKQCITVADCASPYVCVPPEGQCVAPPSTGTADANGGCSCRQVGGESPVGTAMFAVFGLLLRKTRRRARRA